MKIVIVLLQLRVVADEACVPELRPAEMKRIAGDKAGAISGWMKQQLIKLGCSLTVKVRILGPARLAAAVPALATRANAADGMRHGSRGMSPGSKSSAHQLPPYRCMRPSSEIRTPSCCDLTGPWQQQPSACALHGADAIVAETKSGAVLMIGRVLFDVRTSAF